MWLLLQYPRICNSVFAVIVATDGNPEGGDKVKREKKVYDMPGQTKETPDEV